MLQIVQLFLILPVLLSLSCKTRLLNGKAEESSLKIVNGQASVPRAYPFMASVFQEKGMMTICGGALIAPDVVLTAAHCFAKDWFPARNYKIRLGKTNMAFFEEGEELIEIRKIVLHPEFSKPVPLANDIALVYLAQKSRFPPIALNRTHQVPSLDQKLTVIGWGRIDEILTQKQMQLREVELPMVANDVCAHSTGLPIQASQLCAGFMDHTTEKGSCKGDSGGPLFLKAASPILMGIVSGGIGCARIDSPAFYTRVSSFVPWIETQLKDKDR